MCDRISPQSTSLQPTVSVTVFKTRQFSQGTCMIALLGGMLIADSCIAFANGALSTFSSLPNAVKMAVIQYLSSSSFQLSFSSSHSWSVVWISVDLPFIVTKTAHFLIIPNEKSVSCCILLNFSCVWSKYYKWPHKQYGRIWNPQNTDLERGTKYKVWNYPSEIYVKSNWTSDLFLGSLLLAGFFLPSLSLFMKRNTCLSFPG